MLKLLTLLCAGLFATLLIGGEDRGQLRQGLIAAPEPAPKRSAVKPPSPKAEAPVTLATFTPVTVQTKPDNATIGAFELVEPAKTAALAAAQPPAVQPPVAEPVAETALEVMYVSSRSVNVRQGPSTDDEIVGRLSRAEAVTVVTPEVDGWVQIRIEGDGMEGFIAARLLSETDPSGN